MFKSRSENFDVYVQSGEIWLRGAYFQLSLFKMNIPISQEYTSKAEDIADQVSKFGL